MKNKGGTSERKRKFARDDRLLEGSHLQLPEDSHFPTELLEELLARLPVKTLLRFRCVCNSWCQIIDSSRFISVHLKVFNNNSSANTSVLAMEKHCRFNHFIFRQSDIFEKTVDLGKIFGPYQILENFNGLVLMMKFRKKQIVVWNPLLVSP